VLVDVKVGTNVFIIVIVDVMVFVAVEDGTTTVFVCGREVAVSTF
jgi:hypothetical protein